MVVRRHPWRLALSVLDARRRCHREMESARIPERNRHRDAGVHGSLTHQSVLRHGHVQSEAVKLLRAVGAVWFAVIASSAHIGSPDAWYDGSAGPYHVVVQVVAPTVVPGVARVLVRVTDGPAERVAIQANRFDAVAAAPPPELAMPVEGDPGLFSGELWIMA